MIVRLREGSTWCFSLNNLGCSRDVLWSVSTFTTVYQHRVTVIGQNHRSPLRNLCENEGFTHEVRPSLIPNGCSVNLFSKCSACLISPLEANVSGPESQWGINASQVQRVSVKISRKMPLALFNAWLVDCCCARMHARTQNLFRQSLLIALSWQMTWQFVDLWALCQACESCVLFSKMSA